MHINAARLNDRLSDLARIGAHPGGGVERLAFSDEDKAGRDWVEARMRALGMTVRIDRLGNLLGVRSGREDGPLVLAGSHTDTVGNGGRFDGSLGVVAALEAVERMGEEGVATRLPVGVMSFVNEEGVRFQPDMMGSLVVSGQLDVNDARQRPGNGTTVGAELDRTGYGGTDDFTDLDVHAFVELHIEQGPELEASGDVIGVVEQVQGLVWTRLRFAGQANHAGTTPMALRSDAGLAAAAVTLFVRQLTHDIGGGQRATVGQLTLRPNLVNVIPAEAELTVDLRNPDAALLDEAVRCLDRFVDELAADEGLMVQKETLAHVPPTTFAPDVVSAIADAAEALGLSHRRMISGAGHDAQLMAHRWPAAMIFVPSQGGVSHSPAEFTTSAHVEAGANVLLHTLLLLAD